MIGVIGTNGERVYGFASNHDFYQPRPAGIQKGLVFHVARRKKPLKSLIESGIGGNVISINNPF